MPRVLTPPAPTRRAVLGGGTLALLLHGPAAASDPTYLAHPPADASGRPPLLVLLHGSGADERDMIGLWSQLPRVFAVVSPRAPFGGGGGYRWYRKGAGQDADIAASLRLIGLVIDSAVARFGADSQRVFIGGFSQGAVMTYEAALRQPGRFRGAAVLSGTLFPAARAAAKGGARTPFFIAHGTADDRIPYASATAAQAALAGLGVPVAFHAYPGLGHGTSNAEIADLDAWLAARLAG